MKKPKLSLGRGGVKRLFVRHIEKIVFGFSILLVLLFVVLGFRLDSALKDKTPSELESLAATAVKHIERAATDELRKERTPRDGKGGQYDARVVDLGNTAPGIYDTPSPWDAPLGETGMKREDPALFAPIQLETMALTGAICVTKTDMEDEEDLLAQLENAPSTDRTTRRSRDRRSRTGAAGGMAPGMEGLEGDLYEGGEFGGAPELGLAPEMGLDPEGGGRGRDGARRDRDRTARKRPTGPPRRYDPRKVKGYRPSGTGVAGSQSGAPGMGGMDMVPEMGGGYGPGGMPGMGEGRRARVVAETRHVIAVKALTPYRKQVDEFKRALSSATGYSPRRDTPHIVFFQAQRADVTDDPAKELAESDWKDIMNPKKAVQVAIDEQWHGVMPEVADLYYVDRNITMPAPPIMLRDMEQAMLHSEVPKGTQRRRMVRPEREDVEGETDEPSGDENLPGGSNLPGGTRFPGRRGFPGTAGFPGAGEMPGGYGGLPGDELGLPGLEPGGYGMGPETGYGAGDMVPGMGGYGGGLEPEMGGLPGMDMIPGMDMGGEFGGYGGGVGYGRGLSASAEPVPYKLVRFFDTDVDPDRVYRYRVRLFIEDPNNPNMDPANGPVNRPPRRRTLSMEVIERLKRQQADPDGKNVYYVISDWSDVSDPVRLPSTARAFAGDVSPARFSSGAGDVKIPQAEVSGTVAAVVWNDKYAVDVSKEMKAYRGSVLNASGPYEVLDPITLIVKQLDDKESQLRTQYLVVDMFGGLDLPGDRDAKVASVGEFLFIDKEGNFAVRNELEDDDEFRRFTLADEMSRNRSMGGYGGGYPGDEGMYDEMGPGPPGGRRRR